MKGFVAVLSLVLLALVCNSGALHVPAAGVAAAAGMLCPKYGQRLFSAIP